jgi:hypothetical protein
MCAGLCRESWRAVSLPRPTLPEDWNVSRESQMPLRLSMAGFTREGRNTACDENYFS